MSKSILIFELLIIVLIFVAGNRYEKSTTSVVNSPHNLRKAIQGSMSNSGLSDYGDACVYCHLPHESNSHYQPQMWNRIIPTTQYQVQEDSTRAIDTVSLLCLSCHDGTLPLDAVRQQPSGMERNPSNVTISYCTNICHTAKNPAGNIIFKNENFGLNLRNHHPIGIIYDISKNPELNAPSNGKVKDLPLYGPNSTIVGCATCHDPHDNSQRPFLRVSDANVALCVICHNK